jgi:GPH family glycoside/pentoside/hexuronide:cation symporter
MSIIPSVLGVVSIVIFCFYPLNEKKVGQIESDLNERRLAAGEPTPA